MRIQRGKQTELLEPAGFDALVASYERLHIDVGTGDGRFSYELARSRSNTFVVGLDAAAENLTERASKAMRKPAKGGAPNLLYVITSIETAPPELSGRFHEVTVLYPWGSLLSATVGANPSGLQNIAALLAPDADITVLVNASVFDDRPYAETLGLPELTDAYLNETVVPAYRAAGIELSSQRSFHGDPDVKTSWGRHLVRGSGRRSLELVGKRRTQG